MILLVVVRDTHPFLLFFMSSHGVFFFALLRFNLQYQHSIKSSVHILFPSSLSSNRTPIGSGSTAWHTSALKVPLDLTLSFSFPVSMIFLI